MIQLQVLNYILDNKNPSFIFENNLSIDLFSDYKDEFRYIKSHIDRYGNVPDKESFIHEFPTFDFIVVNESVSYLLKTLYDDYNMRHLASVFNKIRDYLVDGKVDKALELYRNNTNISVGSPIHGVDILHDKSRFDAYVERSTDFSKYYVTTGFPELDNILGGWDRNEELCTIVARPGVGKSWVLLKLAIAAAKQGLNVGIYSGEMSDIKVGYRIDTLLSNISNYKITHGDSTIQNDYKRYIDEMGGYVKGSIKVLTPIMLGGYATVDKLRSFVEQDNLEALFIDQYSLIDDMHHGKTAIDRASNISRDLKNLQVLKKIPIISVSQQNRESIENGLDVSKIAQSDRIGQDSTVVIFLEQKDGVLTMHIVKSRDATNGAKLQYLMDIDKGNLTYLPTEEDALNGVSCDDIRNDFENTYQVGEDEF